MAVRATRGDGPGAAVKSAADAPVLDLAFLSRYSMGNSDLEAELLGLFRAQLRAQSTAVAGAADAEAWKFATHTLKGAARAMGAWPIAGIAERLEEIGFGPAAGERRRLLGELQRQIDACEREIDRLMIPLAAEKPR